ncbi:hypothetical protein BGZ52_010507 [Haplosporangium bisporale]|nr:hypothetical protein BGZ52_010507 [Haplosporangium bisporale]
MVIDLFELPHILKSIANSLRFNDLVSCVRVNRTWYDTITPLLWEDVIAYRSIPTNQHDVWTYKQYFLRDHQSRQGLLKNAHHIRALTCQTPQLLTTLNTTLCANLVEINFNTDRSYEAFPAFMRLIARSPKLRAVSVESLWDYPEPERWERVHDLVDVLCKRSDISCFYLEGIYTHARDVEGLCAKALGRIRQDPKQIKKLTLQRRDLLRRSRRGPSQGRMWAARESPLVVPIPGQERWRVIEDNIVGNNGRWENETWTPMVNSNGHTLAVMETPGELQVVVPYTFSTAAYSRFLDQFTNCQDITIGHVEKPLHDALVASLQRLPNVSKIDQQTYRFNDPTKIPACSNKLTSVRLHSIDQIENYTLLDTPLSTQLGSLVDLDLDFRQFTFTELMHILVNTPSLQMIRIPSVIIQGTEQELMPAIWASSHLQQVSLGLYLKCHRDDLKRGYVGSWGHVENEERNHVKACATDIAIALTPMFLEQLNSQSELCELELSFNNRLHPRLSPFLQLSLDPVAGLPRLSNLKKLEKLVITGLAHRLGQQEIEWMSRQWPRLRWIEVPVLDYWVDTTEAVSCTRYSVTTAGQEVEAPRYDQWFPRLHVVIPIDCYSCGRCWSLHCPCRSLYEVSDFDEEEDQERYDAAEALGCEREVAAKAAAEVEREAKLVDPHDDLYLGRQRQHRSGCRPKPKRTSRE